MDKTSGPCAACGKNPAAGFASLNTREGERWYCHGDSTGSPTCYELAQGAVILTSKDEKLFRAYLIQDGKAILSQDDTRREQGRVTIPAPVRTWMEGEMERLISAWDDPDTPEKYLTDRHEEVSPLLEKVERLYEAIQQGASMIRTRQSLN